MDDLRKDEWLKNPNKVLDEINFNINMIYSAVKFLKHAMLILTIMSLFVFVSIALSGCCQFEDREMMEFEGIYDCVTTTTGEAYCK